MHHITRRVTVALAATLGLGLAIYAGDLYSSAHVRAKHLPAVMDLGTIVVTPQDSPERDAMVAGRDDTSIAAGRREAHGSTRNAT